MHSFKIEKFAENNTRLVLVIDSTNADGVTEHTSLFLDVQDLRRLAQVGREADQLADQL